MGKSTKILSLTLVFILLFSSSFLFSCQKPVNADTPTDTVAAANYIIKTEIKDGCIWVTYSNDPENPVNIGAFGSNGETHGESSLTFMLLANGTYGVTAGNSRYLDTIVIPESYNGKAVTTILENAFNGAINLKNITIPNSITSVGDHAFENCANLEYTEHDNGLYLGNPENPHLILVKAKDATITRCVVNENAVAICDNAFHGCSELSNVEIPNSVKNIGSYAFKGCTSLPIVNFPEGNTYIGPETFEGCANLQEITIPASVTSIGKSAFAKCVSLKKVIFVANSALKSIANEAFNGCEKLKTITIPKNVEYIGDNKATSNTNGVFNNCTDLESVNFENGSQLKQIGNFAFNNCKALATVTLPETVNQIGHSAFRGSGLKSIKLPNNLATIADNTFYNCDSLQTVTFGTKLNKIGYQSFADCKVLNNVTLPESLRTIGSSAFYKCDALNSVTVKDATSWYVISGEPIKIDAEQFADPATAALYLTDTYYDCYFGK